jgi:hypothetical protein
MNSATTATANSTGGGGGAGTNNTNTNDTNVCPYDASGTFAGCCLPDQAAAALEFQAAVAPNQASTAAAASFVRGWVRASLLLGIGLMMIE